MSKDKDIKLIDAFIFSLFSLIFIITTICFDSIIKETFSHYNKYSIIILFIALFYLFKININYYKTIPNDITRKYYKNNIDTILNNILIIIESVSVSYIVSILLLPQIGLLFRINQLFYSFGTNGFITSNKFNITTEFIQSLYVFSTAITISLVIRFICKRFVYKLYILNKPTKDYEWPLIKSLIITLLLMLILTINYKQYNLDVPNKRSNYWKCSRHVQIKHSIKVKKLSKNNKVLQTKWLNNNNRIYVKYSKSKKVWILHGQGMKFHKNLFWTYSSKNTYWLRYYHIR